MSSYPLTASPLSYACNLRRRVREERHRHSLAVPVRRLPSRASHTMNIVLHAGREVVVDHHADVLHVQPARRHIGRHHDRHTPRFELVQHEVALALLLVSVDRQRVESALSQRARQLVRAALGLREDDAARFRVLGPQNLQRFVQLLPLRHTLDHLLHVVGHLQVQRANIHLDRVRQEVASQRLHLLRPGRRPHQRLPIGPNLRDDLADLRLESHVEHAVGFVHHQIRHATQVRHAGLQKVQQAPRRGDHDLRASTQIVRLVAPRHASVHARIANPARGPEPRALLLRLVGQLARGGQHQADRAVAGPQHGLGADVDDGGEDERQGFARARRGNADHVAAGESHRPALRLDGGGGLEACTVDHVEDVG